MVGQILAWNFVLRAEIPDAGFAGDLGTARAGLIGLTLFIDARGLFVNDTRDLVRASSSPAKRNVANVLIVFSEFVIDITERITLLIGDHTVIDRAQQDGGR